MCPRLARNVHIIDVMDIFLESVGNLCLVLLSLSLRLSMPIWMLVSLMLILATLVCYLPSSMVSSVTIEVLFGCLSSKFTCTMLGLTPVPLCWWGFHIRGGCTSTPAWALGIISILLNNIYGLLHCWRTLATSSITMSLWDRLHNVICTSWRITSSISVIILIILVLLNVV